MLRQESGRRRRILSEAIQNIRLNEYIPHDPTLKQRVFLALPHKEALFGGSAGGGKSDALLMAALMYFDVPGYSAILFRKTLTDLQLADALIPRSHEWLTGKAEWSGSRHEWKSPQGATLAFGYLADQKQKYRYQGAAFQFIGFDELTQFPMDDYMYLFSRLRRLEKNPVPLRFRAATNPGGMSHLAVKKRFGIRPKMIRGETRYVGSIPDRPFVPSLLSDNPYLDQETYEDSLRYLDPVTREQLLKGDWGVVEDGRFRSSWAKYYSQRAKGYMTLGPEGRGEVIHQNECQKFMVVDPAASTKEGPGDHHYSSKGSSRTVIGGFMRTLAHNHILWADCDLGRWEIPEVMARIIRMFKAFDPDYVVVEKQGLGAGIVASLELMGLPIKSVTPRNMDKLVKATDAVNRMERGSVWFPEHASWLDDVQGELFTWTGDPKQPDDVVDVLAYAALEVTSIARDNASLFGVDVEDGEPFVVSRPDDSQHYWSMT